MPETHDHDLHAIEALHRRDVAASKAGDFETLRALIDDDAVLMPPGRPPYRGRAALDASFQTMQTHYQHVEVLDYDQRFEEVVVLGNYAFEWGVLSGSQRSEGQISSSRYNLMRILKKQPDGAWKVYRSIWNEISSTTEAASASTAS